MIRFYKNIPYGEKEREESFTYNPDNQNDLILLDKIHELLRTQPRCDNCVYYRREGNFGGYCASSCEIHGNIEWAGHPRHDGDGSKCKDYKRKEK